MLNEFIVDNRSIDIVVDKFSDMIIRIAYKNLKNMKDAEDVAQEIFLKLIQSGKSFDSYDHLKAWLIRVTINKCNDVRRSAWFRKTVPFTHAMQNLSTEHRSIMEKIWMLPVRYRNVIYLYYYEGYTTPEIAELLDKSINTINSQLQRARKKLKTILEEDGDFS